MIDQHTHTIASPDAADTATVENYLKKAKALGLKGLTFTDHVDFDTPDPLFWTVPDFEPLFESKTRLNESLPSCTFGVGVELGWQPQVEDRLRALTRKHPFDLVIMSLHAGDGLDFHNGDFFNRYGRERGIERYFELVLESLRTYTDFDVYGHIDYISRYVPGEPKDYDFTRHEAIIDRILRRLVELDKAVEINTSGVWKYGLKSFNPKREILRRFRELGGRKVVLGSDTHDPGHLTEGFEQAISELKRAGFTHICHYIRRDCTWVKI